MINKEDRLGEIERKLREAEDRISFLLKEIETLEMALEETLHYCSVTKYNNIFHMEWSAGERRKVDKKLYAYCLARAVKIHKCETDDEQLGLVNSYPLMLWDDFLYRDER
jgi:hypothetical protein